MMGAILRVWLFVAFFPWSLFFVGYVLRDSRRPPSEIARRPSER